MLAITVRGVLLDIEGTTSSVSYVYDVLFPYARQHLRAYLQSHWQSPETQKAVDLLASDVDAKSLTQDQAIAAATQLMDGDVKATGLKELQGLIWRTGFESGQLRSHVYDDVPPALMHWAESGLDVRIFSSGSIAAQKLFFAHTEHGNLLPYLHGHYDTTTGVKRIASSYQRIADEFALPPAAIVFLNDVVEELDAARVAGLATVLMLRPGNAPVLDHHDHPTADHFGEITIFKAESQSFL